MGDADKLNIDNIIARLLEGKEEKGGINYDLMGVV